MTDAGGYVLDQNLTRSGLIDIHVLDGQPRSRVFVLAQDCGFQVFLLILWRGGVTCSAPTPRLASSAEQMTLRVKRSAGNADNPAAMPRNSASLSARNIPFYGLPTPVQGLRSRRRRCGPDWAQRRLRVTGRESAPSCPRHAHRHAPQPWSFSRLTGVDGNGSTSQP